MFHAVQASPITAALTVLFTVLFLHCVIQMIVPHGDVLGCSGSSKIAYVRIDHFFHSLMALGMILMVNMWMVIPGWVGISVFGLGALWFVFQYFYERQRANWWYHAVMMAAMSWMYLDMHYLSQPMHAMHMHTTSMALGSPISQVENAKTITVTLMHHMTTTMSTYPLWTVPISIAFGLVIIIKTIEIVYSDLDRRIIAPPKVSSLRFWGLLSEILAAIAMGFILITTMN